MGAMLPPRNPRSFRQAVYELTPVDEVRLLAAGLSAETIDKIRAQLKQGWAYGAEFPLMRVKVYVGPRGVEITQG